MTTRKISMTLAKATPADFKAMWKISKLMQEYGYQFYPDDDSPRAVRIKNLMMARLDQLGSGGFMRVVMGCEMLIDAVCDPAQDHLALKPVMGAATEMLSALQAALPFMPKTSVADGGAAKYSESVRAADLMRAAISNAKGGAI